MQIAVISDIHENFHNLILALEKAKENKAEAILCLGDLINAGVAKILAIQEVPVYMIWGNNDGEKVDVVKAAFREKSALKVSLNVYDFLTLGGRQIFMSHYNDLAKPMAHSGLYDAIFYGHDHLKSKYYINETLVVNPGEICGQKTGTGTMAIYNTENNTAEIIELEGGISYRTELVDRYLKEHMDRLDFRSQASFRTD